MLQNVRVQQEAAEERACAKGERARHQERLDAWETGAEQVSDEFDEEPQPHEQPGAGDPVSSELTPMTKAWPSHRLRPSGGAHLC